MKTLVKTLISSFLAAGIGFCVAILVVKQPPELCKVENSTQDNNKPSQQATSPDTQNEVEPNSTSSGRKEENVTESQRSPTSPYTASSRGSKYYNTGSSGAKQLSEKNKIYFNSKEEAEKAGYTAAKGTK